MTGVQTCALPIYGQDIGGSTGQDREWYSRTNHAFRGFVDRPVAARYDHEIGAACDMIACKDTRCVRAGGRSSDYVMSVLGKDFLGPVNERSTAPKDFAGARIIDQDSIPVGDYGICSRFFVRLK